VFPACIRDKVSGNPLRSIPETTLNVLHSIGKHFNYQNAIAKLKFRLLPEKQSPNLSLGEMANFFSEVTLLKLLKKTPSSTEPLISAHPETPIKIPKLPLWTPNNEHLGIQSFSFGSVSGWTLIRNRMPKHHTDRVLDIPPFSTKQRAIWEPKYLENTLKSVIYKHSLAPGFFQPTIIGVRVK